MDLLINRWNIVKRVGYVSKKNGTGMGEIKGKERSSYLGNV